MTGDSLRPDQAHKACCLSGDLFILLATSFGVLKGLRRITGDASTAFPWAALIETNTNSGGHKIKKSCVTVPLPVRKKEEVQGTGA